MIQKANMEFYRSNLLTALHQFLKNAREAEAKMGYTRDSGFVGGIQELVDKVQDGETAIYLKD